MPFLVDGHNLIPKLGLRLEAVDDEMQLVDMLLEFTRRTRATVEVFFDGAPAGQAGNRRTGRVTAVFVSSRSTADAAIAGRLERLGRSARNWVVVSSDAEVQNSARAKRAQVMSAEDFARMARDVRHARGQPRDESGRSAPALSEDEVREWLIAFRTGKK